MPEQPPGTDSFSTLSINLFKASDGLSCHHVPEDIHTEITARSVLTGPGLVAGADGTRGEACDADLTRPTFVLLARTRDHVEGRRDALGQASYRRCGLKPRKKIITYIA
jgi:hypothetical protein